MLTVNSNGRVSRATILRRRVVGVAFAAGLASTPMLASAQTFFDWIGPANGNYTTPANWSPVGVPDVAGEAFRLNGGTATLAGTVTVDRFSLGGGTLTINNVGALQVGVEPLGGPGLRGFGAGGTIVLNSVGSTTSFLLTGGVAGDRFVFGDPALATPSVIELSASTANQISSNIVGLVLVNRGRISGAGAVGANLVRVENASGSLAQPAIIESSRTGTTLTIDPPSSGMLNDGILRSVAGTLRLESGTITQTANGVIDINSTDPNARVQLAATIVGGQLNQSTVLAAQTYEAFSSATLENTTVNSARVRVPNGNTVGLRGTTTINAAADFRLDSVGSTTGLQPVFGETSATLAGPGRLTMSNSGANALRAASTGQTLVNNLQQGVVGAGTIGGNVLFVVNNTLIEANGSAGVSIDPPAEGFDNNGTLRAAANSTMTLTSGPFQNEGGIIDAVGTNAVVIITFADVLGGELASSSGGEIRLPFATLNGVSTRTGTNLRVPNAGVATILGTIVHNGTILLDSVGSTTSLQTGSASASISGTGQITASNSGGNSITGSGPNQTLTLSNTGGFLGSGAIGNNTLNIINNTSIVASGSAGISIDPPTGAGVGFDNNGTIRAGAGSQVTLQVGPIDNADGTILADAGGTVTFNNSTVTGGTIGGPGSGLHRATSGSTFSNVTIPAGATLTIPNVATPVFTGALTLNGTVELASVGSTTWFVPSGNLVVSGSGQISMGNSNGNSIRSNSAGERATFNNAGGVRGSGGLGDNLLAVTNNTTIASVGSVGLRIDPPADANFINNATLQAESGSTLALQQGTYDNANGTIRSLAGGTVAFQSATINGGSLIGAAGADMTANGSALFSGVTIAPDTTLRVPNAQIADLRNGLTNNGTLRIDSIGSTTQLRVINDMTVTGSGTISLPSSTSVFTATVSGTRLTNQGHTIRGTGNLGNNFLSVTNRGRVIADVPSSPMTIQPPTAGSFLNEEGGLVHLTTGNVVVSSGALTNVGGTVIINEGRLLDRQGAPAYVQTAGTTIVNGELEVDSNALFLQGGTLAGAGTGTQGRVDSNVSNTGGVVAPGGVQGDGASPTGILTIEGTFTQSDPGELAIQITDTTPGTDYDRLVVTGLATLGGTLRITLAPGYTPVIGDTFDVLTAPAINGSFNTVIVENEPFDLQANLETQLTRVRITIGERCLGDYDRDGGLTPADVSAFFADFEEGAANADLDQDGGITPADVSVFFNRFESGC